MSRFENKPRWTIKGDHSEHTSGSRIITTPEEIVRQYRRSQYAAPPFAPKRPRIAWYRKINWGFVVDAVCGGLLALVLLYLVIWVVIPFVRMIWMVS
jgi:hypothetical protein